MQSSSTLTVNGWPRDLLFAAGATLLACVLYYVLGPVISARTPLVPFLIAVLLGGYFSTRAGYLTVTLAALAIATALPPVGIPLVVTPADQIVLLMFLATATCIELVCLAMHRGRQRILIQGETLKVTEQNAIRLNKRFQMALDAGRMIAWDWDLAGTEVMRSQNSTDMFGLSNQSFSEYLELVQIEDRSKLESAVQGAISEGSEYYCEYRLRFTDGAVHWLGERANIVDFGAGNRHLAGVAADITDRITLEEQLRGEQRQKDIFLAILAHELRNPLVPISTGLEIFRRTLSMPDTIKTIHSSMERQLTHISKLIDDLLDVSRIAHGKIALIRQNSPLLDILEASLETVQPMLNCASQKIDIDTQSTSQAVDGDPVRLTQVFANILNNASQFSQTGETIKISIRDSNEFIEILIRDNGIGIPPKYLKQVLELFWQVPVSEGGSPSGLGIGLSLSSKLVMLHAGTLLLESEGIGHGTTVIVSLPRFIA